MRRDGTRALARLEAAIGPLEDATVVAHSLKCAIIATRYRGAPVVAKVLDHADAIWRWYFEREVAVLGQLPRAARAPMLIDADIGAGVMILEAVAGRAMAPGRRARGVSDDAVGQVLAISDSLASWTIDPPLAPPSARLSSVMRSRLLEDPGGLDWIIEGASRCASLGVLSASDVDRIHAALARYPIVAPQHGDVLPRNIMVSDGDVRLVDWECAGAHARDWDRALLWAGLGAAGRRRVEVSLENAGPERRAAFRALAAFALAREIKFARRDGRLADRLRVELAVAISAI